MCSLIATKEMTCRSIGQGWPSLQSRRCLQADDADAAGAFDLAGMRRALGEMAGGEHTPLPYDTMHVCRRRQESVCLSPTAASVPAPRSPPQLRTRETKEMTNPV